MTPVDRLSTLIPEPALILLGCRPWDARDAHPCPVCRGGVRPGDNETYCARCDSTSPAVEAQVVAARLAQDAQQELDEAERQTRETFRMLGRPVPRLTERERRRIWLGYSPHGLRSPSAQVVNRARVGRDWLRAIGQLPDWTLKIDRHGRVIGRYGEPVCPEDTPEPLRTSCR